MILEMKYECGCVMSRMRESEPFELKKPCPKHGGSLSSAASGAGLKAYGQLDELPGKPSVVVHSGGDAHRYQQHIRMEQEARSRHFYPQHREGQVWAICEYDVDDNIAECFNHGGKMGHQNAEFVANALNAYVGSKHGPVTQRVTAKSNNERDCEWRNVLREAIMEFDKEHGTTLSQSWEAPPSGPAVFAFRDLLTQVFTASRTMVIDKLTDEYALNLKRAMGK